jgi:hypothetical protein
MLMHTLSCIWCLSPWRAPCCQRWPSCHTDAKQVLFLKEGPDEPAASIFRGAPFKIYLVFGQDNTMPNLAGWVRRTATSQWAARVDSKLWAFQAHLLGAQTSLITISYLESPQRPAPALPSLPQNSSDALKALDLVPRWFKLSARSIGAEGQPGWVLHACNVGKVH